MSYAAYTVAVSWSSVGHQTGSIPRQPSLSVCVRVRLSVCLSVCRTRPSVRLSLPRRRAGRISFPARPLARPVWSAAWLQLSTIASRCIVSRLFQHRQIALLDHFIASRHHAPACADNNTAVAQPYYASRTSSVITFRHFHGDVDFVSDVTC